MSDDGQGEQSTLPVVQSLDLTSGWWMMVGLGALATLFCPFFVCIDSRGHRLLAPMQSLHCSAQWRGWELGAVAWSFCFGFYYFHRLTVPTKASSGRIKIICTVAILAMGANLAAGVLIWLMSRAVFHVAVALLGSALFALADYLLFISLKHTPEDHRAGGNYRESLLAADAPMFVGGLVLLCYLLLQLANRGRQEETEAFAGGALSFQLIASNVIFVLSQGGFIRRGWEMHFNEHPGQVDDEPHHNLCSGVALMCCVVGLLIALLRGQAISGGRFLCWVGLVMLTAGVILAIVVWRRTNVSKASDYRSATLAMVVGGVGFLCLALMSPPSGMCAAKRLTKLLEPEATLGVTAVALSPDGRFLARGSSRPEYVQIIDTSSGATRPVYFSEDDGGSVRALAFSGDGKLLACSVEDKGVMLLDTGTGLGRRLPDMRAVKKSALDALSLAFSPDGEILAAGGRDGHVYFWRTHSKTGEQRGFKDSLSADVAEPYEVGALAFSGDGKWLATGGKAVRVSLWRIEELWSLGDGGEKLELGEFNVEPLRGGGLGVFRSADRRLGPRVRSLALAADGSRVAAGLEDGSVRLWKRDDPASWSSPRASKPYTSQPVLALLFSDDAEVLASASGNFGVALWTSDLSEMVHVLDARAPASSIAFSQDGRAMASGNLDDGKLRVWQPD